MKSRIAMAIIVVGFLAIMEVSVNKQDYDKMTYTKHKG